MAKIDIDTTKKIVENAFRKNGFEGIVKVGGIDVDLERGWKQNVQVGDQTFPITINLQKFRDAIAQAIVDTLTATDATGNISTGNNTPQSQTITDSDDINLEADSIHLNGDDSSEGAARENDEIMIDATTDPAWVTWSAAVGSFTGAGPLPTLTGKITKSSDTVKIGD